MSTRAQNTQDSGLRTQDSTEDSGLSTQHSTEDSGLRTQDLSESRSLKALRDIVESGRPLTYIRSAEEQRIAQLLRDAARSFFNPPIPVWTWSLTEGMRRDDGTVTGDEPLNARAALDFIAT